MPEERLSVREMKRQAREVGVCLGLFVLDLALLFLIAWFFIFTVPGPLDGAALAKVDPVYEGCVILSDRTAGNTAPLLVRTGDGEVRFLLLERFIFPWDVIERYRYDPDKVCVVPADGALSVSFSGLYGGHYTVENGARITSGGGSWSGAAPAAGLWIIGGILMTLAEVGIFRLARFAARRTRHREKTDG